MAIGDICNREVVIIEKNDSINKAIELMRKYHVGDVAAVEERFGQRASIGILTDRDSVIELLAENIDLTSVAVGDVMSYEVKLAREGDDLIETIKRMKSAGVRRMPVVSEQGALVEILTLDDLMDLVAEMLSDFVELINKEQTKEKKIRQ